MCPPPIFIMVGVKYALYFHVLFWHAAIVPKVVRLGKCGHESKHARKLNSGAKTLSGLMVQNPKRPWWPIHHQLRLIGRVLQSFQIVSSRRSVLQLPTLRYVSLQNFPSTVQCMGVKPRTINKQKSVNAKRGRRTIVVTVLTETSSTAQKTFPNS